MLQFHRKADSLAYQKYTISFGMRFKVGVKYGDIRWFSNPPMHLDVRIDDQKDRDVPDV